MMRSCLRSIVVLSLSACLGAAVTAGAQHKPHADESQKPPRFTEEREAAALVFLRNNQPAMLPMLERLKKADRDEYEKTISHVFQTSEKLTHLQQKDPAQAKLALQSWQAQTRLHLIAATLVRHPNDKKLRQELRKTIERLVDAHAAQMAHQAAHLKKQLQKIKKAQEHLKQKREQMILQRLKSILDTIAGQQADSPKDNTPQAHLQPPKTRRSQQAIEAVIKSLFVKDTAWRQIPWKTTLLEGIHASRAQKKPIICWVFIDRPVDDERC